MFFTEKEIKWMNAALVHRHGRTVVFFQALKTDHNSYRTHNWQKRPRKNIDFIIGYILDCVITNDLSPFVLPYFFIYFLFHFLSFQNFFLVEMVDKRWTPTIKIKSLFADYHKKPCLITTSLLYVEIAKHL